MIDDFIEKLIILLNGKIPDKISLENIPDKKEQLFADKFNKLICFMQETHNYIIPLAKGELTEINISHGNFFGSPFKELHSRLLHLTWQTEQIANGDFSQRVDFMGDFSEAFNSMIVSLSEAKESLITERSRLSSIIEATNIATWEWNIQTGMAVVNERWANMIGYTLDEISPVTIDTWTNFNYQEDIELCMKVMNKHLTGELELYECESRMKHKNGSYIWVYGRGKVIKWTDDGKPLFMFGSHQDITTRKENEKKIEHMATHDALTGLPGLRLAKDRAFMAIRTARRKKISAAILFLDLDGFKKVNDTFGHEKGDILLKETAKRLISCVRTTDTVARIGGDEFLIILTEIQVLETAAKIAEKIVKKTSQPHSFNSSSIQVGASIGIAIYPDQGEDVDYLIKQADKAMYHIKNSGKNGYSFSGSNKTYKPQL